MSVIARGRITIVNLNDGAKGTGISSTVRQYYLSTSSTGMTGGSWGTSMPTPTTKTNSIWQRDVITYSDGKVDYTTAVCISSMVASYSLYIVDDELTSIAKSQNQSTMSGLISDMQSKITQNSTAIATKVSQTDYDNNNTAISNHFTTVEQTASSISTRVTTAQSTAEAAQTDLTNYKSTVSSTYSTITQTATSIATCVAKNGVISAINQTAESVTIDASKVNLVAVNNSINSAASTANAANGTANALKTEVSVARGSYASLSLAMNGIKSTCESYTNTQLTGYSTVSQTASSINLAVANVAIGGRNYVLNSNFTYGLSYWNVLGSKISITTKDGKKCAYLNAAGTYTESNLYQSAYDFSQYMPAITAGNPYTISFMMYRVSGTLKLDTDGYMVFDDTYTPQPNTWVRITKTVISVSASSLSLNFYGLSDSPFTGYITDIKLESGNKATDWTAAPEDTTNALIATGINIKDKIIVATAPTFLIQDSNGTTNTVFETVNGVPMLKTSYIQTQNIDISGTLSERYTYVNRGTLNIINFATINNVAVNKGIDANPAIVVLPMYESYSGGNITTPGYVKAGTGVSIMNTFNPNMKNWDKANLMLAGTGKNTLRYQLNASAVFIIADPRIIAFNNYTGSVPTIYADGSTNGNDSVDYRKGRMFCNGRSARMAMILPGQIIRMQSAIETYEGTSYLVWYVVNASEFTTINKYLTIEGGTSAFGTIPSSSSPTFKAYNTYSGFGESGTYDLDQLIAPKQLDCRLVSSSYETQEPSITIITNDSATAPCVSIE